LLTDAIGVEAVLALECAGHSSSLGGSGYERQATGNFSSWIGSSIVRSPEPLGWVGVYRLRLHGLFSSMLRVRCV
jgi:hypothetical protein